MKLTLGEKLAEERRKKGKTIKDIEKALNIRSRYIELVEGNRFDELPGSAYAKAFIRSYAKFLNLDPDKYVEEYVHYYEKPVPQEYQRNIKMPEFELDVNWRILAVIALVLAIVVLSLYFFKQKGAKEETIPTEEPKTVVEETVETTMPPREDIIDTETETGTETTEEEPEVLRDTFSEESGDISIEIRVTDEKGSWLEVVVDGERQYVGILQKDEEKEWTAKQSMAITIGNPKGIVFKENGEVIPSKELGMYYEKTLIEEDG